MTRADELKQYAYPAWPENQRDRTGCYLTLACDGVHARGIIQDLESALVESEKLIEDARAEVPEWCKHIVRYVYATESTRRWRDVLTKDRLRACGIDVP